MPGTRSHTFALGSSTGLVPPTAPALSRFPALRSSSTTAPKNSSRTIADDSDDSDDAAEPSAEPTAPADAAE